MQNWVKMTAKRNRPTTETGTLTMTRCKRAKRHSKCLKKRLWATTIKKQVQLMHSGITTKTEFVSFKSEKLIYSFFLRTKYDLKIKKRRSPYLLSGWSGTSSAFPRWWSASAFLLSCCSSPCYLVWPQRAGSDHTAVRRSDTHTHTHSPAAIPPGTRRPLRMRDAVHPWWWLDDASAKMEQIRVWQRGTGWASPTWQLPARSRRTHALWS